MAVAFRPVWPLNDRFMQADGAVPDPQARAAPVASPRLPADRTDLIMAVLASASRSARIENFMSPSFMAESTGKILYRKRFNRCAGADIQQDQSGARELSDGAGLHRSIALRFPSGLISYDRLPPHEADVFTSTSEAFAFGVSFTGHRDAVTGAPSERPTSRSFPAGTVGLNGVRPLAWLRVEEPSEGLEIQPAGHVLASIADMTGCDWRTHDGYLQVDADVVVWGACARFRTAALGAQPITPLEADTRILEVAHHVAVRYLGGRSAQAFRGRLDQRRLGRVCDYLRDNLDRRISLQELSSVAAMSPFHFQRTFKRSTGLSPSDFVLAMRAERAHRALVSGATLGEACTVIGLTDGSYLRRILKRFVG